MQNFIMVGRIEAKKVMGEEMVDQEENTLCRRVPRNHAQEILEHVTQGLNEELRLVGDQEVESRRLDGGCNKMGVEGCPGDESGDEIYQRPQNLRIICLSEYMNGNREHPLED
jgi:hypothetical protein